MSIHDHEVKKISKEMDNPFLYKEMDEYINPWIYECFNVMTDFIYMPVLDDLLENIKYDIR